MSLICFAVLQQTMENNKTQEKSLGDKFLEIELGHYKFPHSIMHPIVVQNKF